MHEDNYLQALLALKNICTTLYGGYYEPKSIRDKQLADELYTIYQKHEQTGKSTTI